MSTAIVQRAGYGDVINILPIAQIMSELDGEPPTVFVQPGKETIFEAVSYARAAVTDPRIKLGDLTSHLTKKFKRVLVPQVCGDGIAYDRCCESFTKEAWNRCGLLPFWGRKMPLFDLRNRPREQGLVDVHIHKEKPTILVNLTGSSSPYPHASWLWGEFARRFSNIAHLVNLAGVRSVSIVDLLGLYARAFALVTIDTATLHLAAASTIKTAALIVDTPTHWHGSVPLRRPEIELRYNESRKRIDELFSFIYESLDDLWCGVYHVFSGFVGSDDEARRNDIARKTWAKHYDGEIRPMPVLDEQLPRMFDDGPRKLPFINDIIDFGFLQGARHVLLTNTDTCVSSGFDYCKLPEICWSHRRDFKRLDGPIQDDQIKDGEWYPGTDFFFISHEWWAENRNKLPDMVLGAEAWDCLLRELMRETGGVAVEDIIYHERHDSIWERAENRYRLPSQHFCLNNAKKFFAKRGIDPEQFGII